MKRLGIIALAALLLSGCSAAASTTPTDTPTPTEAASPNIAACQDWGDITMTLAQVLNSDEDGAWETMQASLDEVALTAEGTVQDRMLALSENWPDYTNIVLWNDYTEINPKLEAVSRACRSEGSEATFGTLTD